MDDLDSLECKWDLWKRIELFDLGIKDAVAVKMDVTSEDQVREGFEKICGEFSTKRVDVLVANAGFQHISPIEEFSLEQWQKMV